MRMVYLWRIPDEYPQHFIGEYDKNNSQDRFEYKRGVRTTNKAEGEGPVINFDKATLSELDKFGCLASNAMVPIVNEKISSVLFEIAPNDVEFCDVMVKAKDGDAHNYKLVNVISLCKGIDHEKSKYTLVPGAEQIMGFRALSYKEGCLGIHKLARDEEYLSHLLVSEEVCNVLNKLGMSGLAFYRPEDIGSS